MNSRLIAAALLALALTACHKEKNPNQIIVKRQKREARESRPRATGPFAQSREITWHGARYAVSVTLQADSAAATVSDGAATYYANRARLVIGRPSASPLIDRTFTRDDFAAHVDAAYLSRSVLSGFCFIDQEERGRLRFAVSIGSPDKNSDECVPLILYVTAQGGVQIEKDTVL